MNGGKINNNVALEFIFAGNSCVTFLNTKTGNRFTFKVKKHKSDNIYFISLLTRPEVYSFIGTVKNNQFKLSKKSVISNSAQSVLVFEYILSNLVNKSLPDFIEIWHEGSCGRCGRRLTTPDSIMVGIGPECLKTIKKDKIILETFSIFVK